MSKTIRISIISVVLIGIAFGLYTFFFQKETEAPGTLTTTPAAGAVGDSAIGREFLAVLLDLKSLELDESVFTEPVFTKLEDFSTVLNGQPVGRRNPFAPISGSAVPPDQTNISASVVDSTR